MMQVVPSEWGGFHLSLLGRTALGVVFSSTAALAIAGAGPAAAAGTYFGTMVLSASTGTVTTATDHRTWVSADAEALDECDALDCTIAVRFVDGCGAVARGADGKFGWAAAGSRDEAERAAIGSLGMSAAPFPDLGSAAPRPAQIVLSSCTKNAL